MYCVCNIFIMYEDERASSFFEDIKHKNVKQVLLEHSLIIFETSIQIYFAPFEATVYSKCIH
jgi:hypothetical protein